MQLVIDTQTGLTTVDDDTNVNRLEAVIIGQGTLPAYIGRGGADHLWISTCVLERLFNLQCDIERDTLSRMIDFANHNGWLKQTEKGAQVRVLIATDS